MNHFANCFLYWQIDSLPLRGKINSNARSFLCLLKTYNSSLPEQQAVGKEVALSKGKMCTYVYCDNASVFSATGDIWYQQEMRPIAGRFPQTLGDWELTVFCKLCELQSHIAAHLLHLPLLKKQGKNAGPSVIFIAKSSCRLSAITQTCYYGRYHRDYYYCYRVSCTDNVWQAIKRVNIAGVFFEHNELRHSE